ncbi:MAG: dihydrofolate reductase family protein, partial [Pseudolabrys sp.]
RLMNSNAIIDQAAAILVTSVGKAREWGIPQERWVFLHGCADGTDTWIVSERERLDTSPSIKGCARLALEMAGKKVADVAAFDLYSCFPSAVEVAMKEIGIADDDPRPISVTGGLPFFGGPGNNYVTHSIAEMMNVVRQKPGSFGMVTANGNYLTKHSAGLYSTAPTEGTWRREDPKKFQAELDGQLAPTAILTALAAHGMRRVLIEGGANTVSRFLAAGCLDRLHVLVSPIIIGSGRASVVLPEIKRVDHALRPSIRVHQIDDEVLFDCDFSAQRVRIGTAKTSI